MKKIDAMHSLYSVRQMMINGRPAVCGDCPHYHSRRYHDKILRKCEAYGMTHSEATNWKKSNEPCGLIDVPLTDDFVPVIDRLKHERIQAEKQIPGQISIWGEAE